MSKGGEGVGGRMSCKDKKKAAPENVRAGVCTHIRVSQQEPGFLWLEQDHLEKAKQVPKPRSRRHCSRRKLRLLPQQPRSPAGTSWPLPCLTLTSPCSSRQSPLLPPRARGRRGSLAACSP